MNRWAEVFSRASEGKGNPAGPNRRENGDAMFKKETFKSKLFWTGIGNVVLGAVLIYKGQVELGIGLVAGGMTAITGSDRVSKVLIALNNEPKGR